MISTLIKGQYQIIRQLEAGGFGTTYLAEDTHRPSHRRCVLKQLKPLTHEPQVYQMVQARFQQEAAALEILGSQSDQIPELYGFFEDAGHFYLAQEWISGQTLAQLLNTHGITSEETVIQILHQILPALDYIHRKGIIHRDLKPDNIILRQRDRRPVLIDFGAVKEVMGTQINSQGQTSSSVVIGTPGFMAAEQAAGRPCFASDLYSLGMTMIFQLTGKLPTELVSHPHTGEIIWRQYAPGTSAALANVLDRAIRYHPRERYSSANEMLAALQSMGAASVSQWAVTQIPTDQAPASSSMPLAASKNKSILSKRPLVKGLVGLCAVGALSIGGFFTFRPQIAYTQGAFDLDQGSFKPAIAKLDQAIQLDSDYRAAYLKRGNAMIEVGEYQAAIQDFDTVLQKDPANTEAYLGRGRAQTHIGQYEAARQDLTTAIRFDAEYAQAFVERGYVHTETGQYDEATSDFTQALTFNANRKIQAQAALGLANLQIMQGQYAAAEKSFTKSINLDPNQIRAYAERGSFFSFIGKKSAAKQDWQTALQRQPVTARDYLAWGQARSRLADKQGALTEFNRALQINPNLAPVYLFQGIMFNQQGQKQNAIATLTKALDINPNLVGAYAYRGIARQFQGDQQDLQGSLQDLNQALTINPNHFDALNTRCLLRHNLQDYEAALQDCNKGLSVNPQFSVLYNQRGLIRTAKKDFQGAIQDLDQAIALNQKYGQEARSATMYMNRGVARLEAGDKNGASKDLNQAVELAPNAQNYYKRGQLRILLFDFSGSQSDLRNAADLYLKDNRTDSYNNVMRLLKRVEPLTKRSPAV